MAQLRVGAGGSYKIAAQQNLHEGLSLLTDTIYAKKLVGCTSLAEAERAIHETVLWQLRVLAGWMPATGTRLIRTAAGVYEIANILSLYRSLASGQPAIKFLDVGALATAWPQLREATSIAQLTQALRSSPWGDSASGDTAVSQDVLTLVWMRRLADVAAPARPWAEAVSAVTAARILFVENVAPSPRIIQVVLPLLGQSWLSAKSFSELQEALPSSTRLLFAGITTPEDLWRAEARVWAQVERDGFRLLRNSLPGSEVVLGAIAILATDAWRVCAALAAASIGSGSSEVLNAVA